MANSLDPQGTADFDWEALQLDGYSKIQRSEMSDRYEKTLTSINEKEVMQGTVAMITKKEVIINIGYKSEGVVASNEFRYNADLKVGDVVVQIDPRYFRPTEVETLLGDPTKAKQKLGWVPEVTVQEICAEMVASDLNEAKRHALLKEHGYDTNVRVES